MQHILNNYPGLDIRAGSVFDLVLDYTEPSPNPLGKISGVLLGKFQAIVGILFAYTAFSDSGEVVSCSQVVICTGTFLSGEIHIGIQVLHYEL